MLNLAGTILGFIAGRKILLDKKLSILVFVILMVSSFVNLIEVFAVSSFWFTVISFMLKLVALVFMILILIRNKILSKLLLTSVILFGIHILIQMIIPFVSNEITSLMLVSYRQFTIAQMYATLNAVNFISRLICFAAMVLVVIYIIKSFVKNNVFSKSSLNKLMPPISILYSTHLVMFSIVVELISHRDTLLRRLVHH